MSYLSVVQQFKCSKSGLPLGELYFTLRSVIIIILDYMKEIIVDKVFGESPEETILFLENKLDVLCRWMDEYSLSNIIILLEKVISMKGKG